MKIISRLISDTYSDDRDLDINYFALAIDQASFLQKIIKENYSFDRQNNFNIHSFDPFLGENISIIFQGTNKNSNGAVQVLNFTDKLYPIGYFDGKSISKIVKVMDNNWLDFKDKIINEQVKAVFSYRDLNILDVNEFVSIAKFKVKSVAIPIQTHSVNVKKSLRREILVM